MLGKEKKVSFLRFALLRAGLLFWSLASQLVEQRSQITGDDFSLLQVSPLVAYDLFLWAFTGDAGGCGTPG